MLAEFWRQVVIILMFVLVFAVSICTALVISNGHPGTLMFAGLIASIFFAICIFIHEIGHAVAAWLVGWRVHLIVIGSLAFAPRRKGFSRNLRQGNLRDLAGWVYATPPPDSVWNKGAIPFILGGAVGNFLLGVLSILAAAAIYESELHFSVVLIGLASASVIFAVANLIPISRSGTWKSDGAALLGIFKGEEQSIHEQKIARLFGTAFDGIPVEKWDASALRELIDEAPNDSERIDPLLISYAFAMADLATAKFVLNRYLKANPDSSLEYQCMYAFAIAMIDQDAHHASKILENLPRLLAEKSFSFWRAQAVTAHLLDRREEALTAIRNARRFADKSGTPPDEDDETVFQAIEQGKVSLHLEPRVRLLGSDKAFLETQC